MASETLQVTIVEDGPSANKLIASVNKLADSSDKLATSTDKSAKSTKSAGDAATKSATSHGVLEKALGGAKSAFGGLQSALSGVAALLSVNKLVEYADGYAGISNKLRLVTTDQTKLNSIIEAAYGIAQDTSTSFALVSDVYGKVSAAAKQYNIVAKDVPVITKAIAQAVALTGPSSEEAANGLRQFGQTLDIGKLQAEELNSIIESTPGLARALEAGIRASGMQVQGSLKAMAAAGQITSKQLLEGLRLVAPQLDILAKGAIPTVAQAYQRLENAAIKYIGQTNQQFGFTKILAGGIQLLTDNVNVLIPALVIATGLLAFGALAGAIQSIASLTIGIGALAQGFVVLTAAMLSNPLILIGTLATIAAAVAAFKLAGLSVSDIAAKLGELATKGAPTVLALAGITTGATTAATATQTAADAARRHGEAITAQASAAVQAQAANAPVAAAQAAQALATQTAAAAVRDHTAAIQAGAVVQAAAAVQAPIQAAAQAAATLGTQTATTALTAQTAAITAGTVAQTTATPVLVSFGVVSNDTSLKVSSVGTAAKSASAGITEISGTSGKATGAFGEVSKAATGAGKGFLEVSMNANRVPVAHAQIAQSSVGVTSAFQGNVNAGAAAKAAFEALVLSTSGASTGLNGTSAAAEKARESLDKATSSTTAAGAAATDTAARLEKLGSSYNSMGEKIQSYTEFLSASKSAQDAANATYERTVAALRQMSAGYEEAGSSASKAASSFGSATSASSGVGGGSSGLPGGGGSGGSADSGSGRSLYDMESLKDQVRNSSGNTDGGTFGYQPFGFDVKYGGYTVGQWRIGSAGYGAANSGGFNGSYADLATAQQQIQALIDARAAANPNLPINDMIKYVKETVENSSLRNLGMGFRSGINSFATGGQFYAGGSGGTDSQYVGMNVSPNERITIETPAQVQARERNLMKAAPANGGQRGQQVVNMHYTVRTDDIDQFRRSERQTSEDFLRRLARNIANG